MGDILALITDDTGNIAYGKLPGGIVDTQHELGVYRPGGGGDNVVHAHGRNGNVLHFGHAAAANEEGRCKKQADMLK